MEKTTVREDIIDFLQKSSETKNPWTIAKVKHRHISSIRKELRKMESANLIDLEIDEKTKHYTLIRLKNQLPKALELEKGEVSFDKVAEEVKVETLNNFVKSKKESFLTRFFKKLF